MSTMTQSDQLPLSHAPSQKLDAPVMHAQHALEQWCLAHQIDAVLITAQDAFLSEYTPLSANFRSALSGFSGSTGDGIFLTRELADKLSSRGRFQLFVDGRYHLQADQETQEAEVRVHKFGLATGLDDALFTWMRQSLPRGCKIAADLQRLSWNRWRSLQALAQENNFALVGDASGEIAAALPHVEGWRINRPIDILRDAYTGRSVEKNLLALRAAICKQLGHKNYIYATCMSDDAAWLLNARAYHLPQLSSVLAYTLITDSQCIVHLPAESETCVFPLTAEMQQIITVTRGPVRAALEALKTQSYSQSPTAASTLQTVCFSGRSMNAALPQLMCDTFKTLNIRDDVHALEEQRAAKTPEELNSIRRSFLRSSRAIARTLRHAKQCAHNNLPLTEQDLSDKIKGEYKAEGALELSFKTISGFAENGAVIHYSTPNKNKNARIGDLLLLDSGAYYEEGFATDCTRVVLFGRSADDAAKWQKEIYTLTLKSCLAGLRARFNLTTPCRDIDAIARAPIQSKGYDYAHGTGHGIGIHVHENGIRLSPASQYSFTENAVVSVEPGIYLAGQGGVRIENVAIIVPRGQSDSPRTDTHGFENVVFVGYDWDLIDLDLLDEDDKSDLAAYERKCQTLGTQVTDCPLLTSY
jgi:Xaa-Pro aminopeptidase